MKFLNDMTVTLGDLQHVMKPKSEDISKMLAQLLDFGLPDA